MNENACIVFDIDGTLVDTTESYNKAIKKTVQFLVKYIDKTKADLGNMVSDELIFKFRKSVDGVTNNRGNKIGYFLFPPVETLLSLDCLHQIQAPVPEGCGF